MSTLLRQLATRLRSIPSLVAITTIAIVVSSVYLLQPSFALTNGGSITALGVPLTENFDTLVNTGSATWVNNSTIPGWYHARTGTGTTIVANNGGSTTGNFYSYGTGTAADRALGSLGSGNAAVMNVYWGVRLTNATGSTITSLSVSYTGEQWRNSAAAAQTVAFSYLVGTGLGNTLADFTATGTAVPQLDFTSPVTGGTAGALDGNASPNRVAISFTITGLSIANGQEILLRWFDPDHSGSDHGLAIDDFSVTATGVPPGDDAPTVASTTPTNGATNVAVDSSIVINFSESVTATASAFSIQCPNGSPVAFSQTLSPASSFTLTPESALPYNTICTVTVTAADVTDTDTNDGPDQMALGHSFSFTTASEVLADDAPTVTTTTPANAAASVAVTSSIVINFSESVSATASAFSIQCPLSSTQTFTPSVSPASSFTLTPTLPLPYNTICSVTVSGSQITDTDTNDGPDQMASDYSFLFTTAHQVATNVIINEVDADTPGTDTAEFVELYDGGAGNTPLDGLVLVFYTGSTDKSYKAFDLDGFSTNANGYFVIGNSGVPGVGLIFDAVTVPTGLQNGEDAVALYVGDATDFPNGTSVTTLNVQDALVYDTDDPDDPGLLALLNAGQPQINENGRGSGTAQSNQRCSNGTGGARNTSTYLQDAPTPGAANTCSPPPPLNNGPVVISQLYGGGGNAGAPYHNDFVELFNRGPVAVDLTGWSLQYASATGNGWDFSKQPIGGTIGPNQYFLIALGSGTAGDGAALPAANITGQINMSGTSGKVALVDSFDGLLGNCPLGDPHVMDLVGYGGADCHEGTAAPAPSNTTSIFRLGGGGTDTNDNGADFVVGLSITPRRTAPIVELGPMVLSSDPRANGVNAPRDATIAITFTEPVDVVGAWFDIACASSGPHNSATTAGVGQQHFITPNVNFVPGEQCTVTIFKDQIHDQDEDDSGPNTDTLATNYIWSFTVSTGTPPPPDSDHLAMGNPTNAAANLGQPNNYLMAKPEYALSYNRDLGRPNWVSWHLSDEWIGSLTRVDSFRPDPQVPADWYRVQSFDFGSTGFDRGHMVPNADRNKEGAIPINQATFLMTNMLAQAPDNNQGPWASFEEYLRTLLPTDEIYIVAGGAGAGGSGANGGGTTLTLADGHVSVPASTWKVALVLPKGSNDISRVSCSAKTIAVIMPNTQGIRDDPWTNYLRTVDEVETLTGYDLFSNLPLAIQACVEAGTNGNNPPLDTTAPSVICASPDGGWHPGNVSFSCTASDGGSGLAHSADASFSLITSVAAGDEDANASTNTRIVCDVAGNCTTAVISGNKIDRKAPSITLTTPANGAIYQVNQVVNAAYGCPDGGSGLGSCIGTVGNLSPIDTTSLGSKTFVVNATDAVGNTSSTTVNYQVRRTLSAVGPVKVWLGLKNSDDVGLRVDLKTELLIDTSVVSTGDVLNVPTGSSGFNNAILQSVAMSLATGSVEVPPGTPLSVRVSVRRTCSGGGHNSGRVLEWFNGEPIDSGATRDAGSRIQLTLGGVTENYFLRSAFGLSTTAGALKQSVELTINSSAPCGARPYSVLGVWSIGSQ